MHFSPYLLLIVLLCTPPPPPLFSERFCTPSFANCVLFKIVIKRGEKGQQIGCKIAHKKEEGVQNRTISKNIGGKSTIEHKDRVQNKKGGKKMGCKIARKKKRGCKIAQLAKNRGKSAVKPYFYLVAVINKKRARNQIYPFIVFLIYGKSSSSTLPSKP